MKTRMHAIVGWGFAAGLLTAAPVYAQQAVPQSAFYIGGAVGQAEAKDACTQITAVGAPLGIAVGCDDTDTSWKVFAGYEFNRHFAVEGGWVDLGKFSASASAGGIPISATVTGKGWELLGVGSIPVNDQFSIYGKAGLFRWRVDASGNAPGVGGVVAEDEGNDFTFGFGLRYNFTRNIGARLEWQRYMDVGDDATTGKSDVDLISLGIVFRF